MPSRAEGSSVMSCLWHSWRQARSAVLREHFWVLSNSALNRESVLQEEEHIYPFGKAEVSEELRWPVPRDVPDCLVPKPLLFSSVDSAGFDQEAIIDRSGIPVSTSLVASRLSLNTEGRGLGSILEPVHKWQTSWTYRSRCRIWFIWRELLRDPWDYAKKPMIIAAVVAYPLIHLLATLGVFGCD